MCDLIVDGIGGGVGVVSQHVRLLVGGPTFGSAALNLLAADLPATSETRTLKHRTWAGRASCP
jgi:hypothetical protein